MQKNSRSSGDDPTSQWPEEVKKAYEHLDVPSLYDCLLANERLSLEMRRQNKEIRTINQELESISSRLNIMMKIFEEDLEVYEVDDDEESNLIDQLNEGPSRLDLKLMEQMQDDIQGHASSFLIETSDSLVDLSRHVGQAIRQLTSLIAIKEGPVSIPAWRQASEELTQSIVEEIDQARYSAIRRLEEWGIKLIEPRLGESFVSSLHHILDYASGGQSGTLARIVRIGYIKGDVVIRPAEVIVYA